MAATESPPLRYRLPLFPLPVVLLPGAPMPLHIFEPRYREMVAQCLETDRRFGMVYHDWDARGPFLSEEGRVGCLAEIGEHEPIGDGRSLIVVTGLERFRIQDGIESDTLYFEALVSPYQDVAAGPERGLAERRRRSIALFEAVVAALPRAPRRLPEVSPHEDVSWLLARTVEVDAAWSQELLELRDERARLDLLDRVFRVALERGP